MMTNLLRYVRQNPLVAFAIARFKDVNILIILFRSLGNSNISVIHAGSFSNLSSLITMLVWTLCKLIIELLIDIY